MKSAKVIVAIFASAVSTPAAYSDTLIIQNGDTLSGLAGKILADSKLWVQLCELNKSVLLHGCDYLTPGMEISLPIAAPTSPSQDDRSVEVGNLGGEPPPTEAVVQSNLSTAQSQMEVSAPLEPTVWESIGVAFDVLNHDSISLELGTVRSRLAVWDPEGEHWIVPAIDYVVDGGSRISFSTGSATSVRVYPLRAPDNSEVVWARFDNLKPDTTYQASWIVQAIDDRATVTEMKLEFSE